MSVGRAMLVYILCKSQQNVITMAMFAMSEIHCSSTLNAMGRVASGTVRTSRRSIIIA